MLRRTTAAAIAAVAAAWCASAAAETINTTDGAKTVVESVAPLGAPLTYVSGGDGLVGFGGSWPNVGSDPTGVNAYDHYWQQFDPAIIWASRTPLTSVFAIPGVDHGPNPGENLEFIIWGSNDGQTWEEGKISAIYRDGFDTANTDLGHSDDYTSLWSFSKGYSLFRATSGDHLDPHYDSVGEGEIDALAAAAPVPEPETYAMFAAGLGMLSWVARRRRAVR
jgi:hypothetical protein